MAVQLTSAPVLSTPDAHILADTEPVSILDPACRLSDEELYFRYEIERTLNEIRCQKWQKVALQFPDEMLRDSARVYRALQDKVHTKQRDETDESGLTDQDAQLTRETEKVSLDHAIPTKLTILGDTSYGACCVDEIAAEHVDADAVIHYGRACLSPTTRLPVMHVFTKMDLELDAVIDAFKASFAVEDKVMVTADTPYASHVDQVCKMLSNSGYQNIFACSIVHDPSSLVPNRTLPHDVHDIADWHVFHISDPPTSLLLNLSSKMKSVKIYPTSDGTTYQSNTAMMLRRRYALVTSLSTVATWGILINTLSVKNYLQVVDHVKKQIENAGKKSYLFVVGKLNGAKIANFAEIGGWVVIGCWESSLVDSKDFYKPIITPFELELVLQNDNERVWTGEWRSDWDSLQTSRLEVNDHSERHQKQVRQLMPGAFLDEGEDEDEEVNEAHDYDSEEQEEESAPPEFDLRTGKYVSTAQPTRRQIRDKSGSALIKKSNGALTINGVTSPAAEFLATKRTWQGLGSDFEVRYEDDELEGSLIEEGRTGVARGYTVADSGRT